MIVTHMRCWFCCNSFYWYIFFPHKYTGYVEENKCEKTSDKLQEELPVLAECALQRRKGRKVPLRVGNQNLEDMLADYSASKDYGKAKAW